MSQLSVLITSLILDLLAFTLILPLFPSIMDYYSLHDESGFYGKLEHMANSFGQWIDSPVEENKVLHSGFLGSWFSLLQFASTPFLCTLSDVYGRKPILILCYAGIAASYLLWFISSKSFLLFTLSRTLGGLFKGNIALSTAIVTDLSDDKNRCIGMAYIGIAFSIGFIVGPVLGAFLSTTYIGKSYSLGQFSIVPALIAVILSSINILYTLFFLKESNKNLALKNSVDMTQAFDFINPSALFSFRRASKLNRKDHSVIVEYGMIYFLFLFIYSGLEYTLAFLAHLRFQHTRMQIGRMHLFIGVLMAIFQGSLVRRIAPGKENKFALIGIVLIIPAFIMIGFANTVPMMYMGLIPYSISSAIVVPTLTTLVSKNGNIDEKGTVLGVFRSIGALARAFGPLAASAVFWKLGSHYAYLLGAFLFLVPLIKMRGVKNLSEAKYHVK